MGEPLNYGYRLRGVVLPIDPIIKKYRKAEYRLRAELLAKLGRTLFSYWHEFASRQFSGIPHHDEIDFMYVEFLHCYSLFLWRFKNARRSDDKINVYWHGVRVNVWDKNLLLWKAISDCHAAIDFDDFYDRLCSLAHSIGMLSREMELFAKDQMNAAEYVIHQKNSTQKGAAHRHSENRSMKRDVFVWLDANMQRFKSMDAAAEAVAGKVAPVKFRTARDWVGEWKKLRSAGTP